MLIKIGDVTNKFGISHRSLHYWENAGILKSSRAENDYRYYDEDNLLRIKQIVLLRKLRLSIPSIQEIFTSEKLSKIVSVFTDHLDETKKETEQLNALGVILRQLLNMLKDRQDMDSVYKYLDTTHSAETEELKNALKTVMSEPAKEIAVETPPEPVVDMTGVDISLEPVTPDDVSAVNEVVKRCYGNLEETDKLLESFGVEYHSTLPDCAYSYKIMQKGKCIGAVNLGFVGMEAMLIRCLAYMEPDNNIYLFELLKQKHSDILCWNVYFPNETENNTDHFCFDWEGKKRRFAEDNGFIFYTDARFDRYIKMLKPHDEVYNSSRYRFALLDGSMDGVSFRFFGAARLDFYDGSMTDWRITDCNMSKALFYDTWMEHCRFYETGLDKSDFLHARLNESKFFSSSFKNCVIENCDLTGMTIDGINVKDALELFKNQN